MKNITIVGNNIAAMMSAITLAEKGHNVKLISSSKNLGGHFRGVTYAGHNFDAGMNLLEFTSYNLNQSMDSASYNPDQRNDVGRFTTLVKDVLKEYGNYHQIETPKMMTKGKVVSADLFISNKLDILSKLDVNTKNKIKQELVEIIENPTTFHARNKTTNTKFIDYSFQDISIANHGNTFHNLFIEPFCYQLTKRYTKDFVSLFHRSLWLPLFYPETLMSVLEGKSSLMESKFYYPDNQSLSSIVLNMENNINSLSNISVIKKKIDHLSEIYTDKLIWADTQEYLMSLCNEATTPPDKVSVALAFVLVNTKDLNSKFTALFVNKPKMPFRITNQSRCANDDTLISKLCVEWNADDCKDIDHISEKTKQALLDLNITEHIVDMKVIVFNNAIMLPTYKNIATHHENNETIKCILPEVTLLGASAPFGAVSLNDQIIQGLKVGTEI